MAVQAMCMMAMQRFPASMQDAYLYAWHRLPLSADAPPSLNRSSVCTAPAPSPTSHASHISRNLNPSLPSMHATDLLLSRRPVSDPRHTGPHPGARPGTRGEAGLTRLLSWWGQLTSSFWNGALARLSSGQTARMRVWQQIIVFPRAQASLRVCYRHT